MKSVIKYTQNILSLCKCDKDIYNLIGKECYFAIRFYLISSRHIFITDLTNQTSLTITNFFNHLKHKEKIYFSEIQIKIIVAQ
jgi:hypothetical protein